MPDTDVKEYRGINGKRYRLSDRLGKGGEGAVYRIQGNSDSVAKIYNNKKSPEEMANLCEKLKAMVTMNINPYQNGMLVVTWPRDVLTNASGKFAGYVMPSVTGRKSLVVACRASERASMLYGSDYTWKKSIATAYNLSLMMECLHRAGIVIGDMNANNILVNNHAQVTLIDCDSFQVRSRDGKLFKCTVGLPETEPPEIQGHDMRKPGNEFTVYSDRFALAIHIFLLLCNGFHPFNVSKPRNGGSSSSGSASTQIKNITQGYCPYVSTRDTAKLPLDAPDMGMLPDYIMELFRRAFGYSVNTAVLPATIQNRPSATEWKDALLRLFNEKMSTCPKHSDHVYLKSYGKCPWCAAAERSRPPRQPVRLMTATQNAGQIAYQKLAPARAAAAAQRAASAATPRNWSYTAPTYRNDVKPLYLLCLICGVLGAILPLQIVSDIVREFVGQTVDRTVLLALSLTFGLAAGWLVAALTKERYLRAVNAWPQLCFALTVPLVTWAGMALTLLAISIVLAIVSILAGVFVAVFIISVFINN